MPPSFRLSQLAELVDGRVEGDPERRVEGVAPLDRAGPGDLSFLTNPRYREQARASRAGALLVAEPWPEAGRDLLVSSDPYWALGRLVEAFHPPSVAAPAVHPTAEIAADAAVDPTASVGAYAVVGAGSVVGPEAQVHPHAVVGRRCRVGARSVLHPQVVLYDGTAVGDDCIVHAGVVLGSDGFGYAPHGGRHVKQPHVGRVVVEDRVEIGANTTVDRAMLAETRIGRGTKIDNLVQIAHNVEIGEGCLLIAQSGLSGSTRLGAGVVMAGQSGAAGHLDLGDGARVAAKTAVFKSVPAGGQVAGIPAVAAGSWRRQQAVTARLPELAKRLRRLERQVSGDRESGKEEGGE